jgi:hypothetical protein
MSEPDPTSDKTQGKRQLKCPNLILLRTKLKVGAVEMSEPDPTSDKTQGRGC